MAADLPQDLGTLSDDALDGLLRTAVVEYVPLHRQMGVVLNKYPIVIDSSLSVLNLMEREQAARDRWERLFRERVRRNI